MTNLLRSGYTGMSPLTRAKVLIRKAIVAENEAILDYENILALVHSEKVRKVLTDIRDEEKAHIGELQSLLEFLDPSEGKDFAEGVEEVAEIE